jgi:hypothetical protein
MRWAFTSLRERASRVIFACKVLKFLAIWNLPFVLQLLHMFVVRLIGNRCVDRIPSIVSHFIPTDQ